MKCTGLATAKKITMTLSMKKSTQHVVQSNYEIIAWRVYYYGAEGKGKLIKADSLP